MKIRSQSIDYDERVPIIGHPNYSINRKGEVYRIDGLRIHGTVKSNRAASRREVILDGKCCDPIKLIAEQFIPNPNGYRFVGAKDDNRLNTHIDNVEWTDRKPRRAITITEDDVVRMFNAVLDNFDIDYRVLSKKYDIPEWIIGRIKFAIQYMRDHDIRATAEVFVSGYKPMVYQGVTSDIYVINVFGILKNNRNGNIVIGNIADGYIKGHIAHNNRDLTIKIHKAVAETFILKTEVDIIQERYIVNHKNGCKFDPCVWNLEWVNGDENREHARLTGLLDSVTGVNSASCVHNENQIHAICQLLSNGKHPPRVIARITNSHRNTVNRIKRGEIWCHISQYYDMRYFAFDKAGNNLGENKEMTKIVNDRITTKMKNSYLNKDNMPGNPAYFFN